MKSHIYYYPLLIFIERSLNISRNQRAVQILKSPVNISSSHKCLLNEGDSTNFELQISSRCRPAFIFKYGKM